MRGKKWVVPDAGTTHSPEPPRDLAWAVSFFLDSSSSSCIFQSLLVVSFFGCQRRRHCFGGRVGDRLFACMLLRWSAPTSIRHLCSRHDFRVKFVILYMRGKKWVVPDAGTTHSPEPPIHRNHPFTGTTHFVRNGWFRRKSPEPLIFFPYI